MRPAASALALLLLAPLAASADDPIQPGDLYNGICTLNFVFDGAGQRAGDVFVGTAAHCVEEVGEVAETVGHADFGTVVYMGDFDGAPDNGIPGTQLDFALILVHPAKEGAVLADVLGHPGFPTGSTVASGTARGDLLLVSGWGFGFSEAAATRENRAGVLVSDNAREYVADTLAVPGDSGGPLLRADGLALGTISRFAFDADPPSTDTGPTVQGILAELAAQGWPVTLRTAS